MFFHSGQKFTRICIYLPHTNHSFAATANDSSAIICHGYGCHTTMMSIVDSEHFSARFRIKCSNTAIIPTTKFESFFVFRKKFSKIQIRYFLIPDDHFSVSSKNNWITSFIRLWYTQKFVASWCVPNSRILIFKQTIHMKIESLIFRRFHTEYLDSYMCRIIPKFR